MAPRKPELLDLPYEGLIDALYPVFQQENRLIVSEREQCRALNPILYETLCVNQVERMVVGPLEANGRLIGLFGAVFCAEGTRSVKEAAAEADARMYRAKELYYQGKNDRRRR